MSKKTIHKTAFSEPQHPRGFQLSEDWLSVILAFIAILLSALGILGKNGLSITF